MTRRAPAPCTCPIAPSYRLISCACLHMIDLPSIGERKIDVLVADPLTPETPLLRAAREQATAL